MDLVKKWLAECSSKEEVLEKLAIEQFLNHAPEDVRIWVRERKPTTCKAAGVWADEFQQARNEPTATPTKTTSTHVQKKAEQPCMVLANASDGSAGSVSSVASTSPIPVAGSYSTSSVSSVDCTTSPVTRVGSASSLLQSRARSTSPAPSEVSTSPVSGVEGIKQVPSVASTNPEEEVVAVVTRAQARQIDDAATESIITGADFDDDLFEGGRERLRLTRRQKRLERHRYASEAPAELSLKPESKWSGLNMTPAELREAKLEDPTLEIARRVAEGRRDLRGGEGFYFRDNLLYRRWEPKGQAQGS